MVVDPDRLEDFVPIKRGYNKKSYLGTIISAMLISSLFFGMTAGWPLSEGMPWWGRILYMLGGCAAVWGIYWLGGGALKGMIFIAAYFLIIYCGIVFSGSSIGDAGSIAYTGGILTFMLCIPFGGVMGWVLQQGP